MGLTSSPCQGVVLEISDACMHGEGTARKKYIYLMWRGNGRGGRCVGDNAAVLHSHARG